MKNAILWVNLLIACITIILLHFDLVQDAAWRVVTAVVMVLMTTANVIIIWRDVIRLDQKK